MTIKTHGCLLVAAILCLVATSSVIAHEEDEEDNDNKIKNVSYDGRSLLIDGKRELLFSGSIHYPRSTPDVIIPVLL